MLSKVYALLSLAMLALTPLPSYAQQNSGDIIRTLHFKAGPVVLKDNLATINQTQNFRFLDNADTQTFLTKVYGNPPGAGSDALGMIIPSDLDPMDEGAWVAVISYEASGYVSDEDAEKIDYDELLVEMQSATAEESPKRVAKGFGTIQLVGWAKKPYYDAKNKKIHWAKHLLFDGNQNVLNYEIRVLGRRGVLSVNIVGDINILPDIEKKIDSIIKMVYFNAGSTYSEYNSDFDPSAAYGLAGLVAGGVLVKTGFLKGLIALLVASPKAIGLLLIGFFAAIWGGLKRMFLGAPKDTLAELPPLADDRDD